MELAANLRAWLVKYGKTNGSIFPAHWLELTANGDDRLKEFGRFMRRTTGLWRSNGLRHSFGSWHFKLYGDPHRTVQTMGTSIAKLDKNYASKATVVTKEQAVEWFAISPI